MIRGAAALVLCVLVTGCAKPAPITNPSLSPVGRLAVRAAQVITAIDVAQRQIEPLVEADVLTANEGLFVAKSFGVALEQAKVLAGLLTVAEAASTIADRSSAIRQSAGALKSLIRTMQGSVAGVGRLGGRIVVGALAGSVTDAVGDLVPELGS